MSHLPTIVPLKSKLPPSCKMHLVFLEMCLVSLKSFLISHECTVSANVLQCFATNVFEILQMKIKAVKKLYMSRRNVLGSYFDLSTLQGNIQCLELFAEVENISVEILFFPGKLSRQG